MKSIFSQTHSCTYFIWQVIQMWKSARTLWKNFLNLALQNENKNRASDNQVSGKKLQVMLHIQITSSLKL